VASLPGPVDRLAAGDSGVYVLYSTGEGSGVPHLGLFDALAGRMTRGQAVPGAVDVAVDGGNVWVSAGGQETHGSTKTRFLYRFDPSNLSLRGRITLSRPPRALAVGPPGLWVGTDGALYLLDPSSGRVLKTVPVNGAIGRLAVDAQNGLLYDSTHPSGDETVVAVEERDAATGALRVRSTTLKGMLAMNALAATPSGVWAAFATGTLGQAELLARSDLRQIDHAAARGANGLLVDDADGILWFPDAMTGHLRCADPVTGKIRAPVRRVGGPYGTDVVLVQGAIYAGTLKGDLVRIHPGRTCTG
jgi:outer membrane protein assembly factor BamB